MKALLFGFIISISTFGFSTSSFASKFANQFVEFELPNNWFCSLEGSVWVCQNNQEPEKQKEAIIVLAAKIQGDQDSIDQYLSYLKNPKSIITPDQKQLQSKVSFAQTRTIQDHPWVDALHMESEVEAFYTRYLATVKDGIGILVTYSVNKDKYAEYQAQFDQLVKSLRAFRREGGLNAAPASSDLFKLQIPSQVSGEALFGNVEPTQSNPQSQLSQLELLMQDPTVFYGGIGVVSLLLISILKKIRKK